MLLIGPQISSLDLDKTVEKVNNSYQKLKVNHFYDVTKPDDTHDNLGPQPRGQRIFYRSDHYNFAKMGIPIAFFTSGLHPDYHRPTDTVEKIDYKQMQIVSKTVAAIAWQLGTQEGRPKVNAILPEQLEKDMKLVKEQNADEPADLLVLRNGKEETIKGAKMPALVQVPATRPNPAFGALPLRPMPNLMIPGARLNQRMPFPNGLFGAPQNMNMEMNIDGAKISKRQNGADFSGEYVKDELRITVKGKLEIGVPQPSEIVIQDGRESKKYKALGEVPAQHRAMVQHLMPVSINNFLLPFMELQQNLQNFPGLPVIPGIDDK